MKILTLWQPWATLIALGVKTHETRSWSTPYRGPLAIHAAKRPMDKMGKDLVRELVGGRHIYSMTYGAIVATAELVAVLPSEEAAPGSIDRRCGDFTPGRFAWRLEDVRQCFVACKGSQGLRDVPEMAASLMKARGLWR